jgi:hypothetical protein
MTARAGVGALGVVLLAILVFLAVASWSRQPAAARPSAQPIAFPHNLHVQTYKMDCQYCHTEARRSEYAGLGCHKIAGGDRPEVKKLQEYFARKEPIPWVRVFKVPEFTYFPHKPHVRAEVQCETCHGQVAEMTTAAGTTGPRIANDLLNLVGLKPAAPPLSMGWCVDCHRRENATRDRKAPLDCVACHH